MPKLKIRIFKLIISISLAFIVFFNNLYITNANDLSQDAIYNANMLQKGDRIKLFNSNWIYLSTESEKTLMILDEGIEDYEEITYSTYEKEELEDGLCELDEDLYDNEDSTNNIDVLLTKYYEDYLDKNIYDLILSNEEEDPLFLLDYSDFEANMLDEELNVLPFETYDKNWFITLDENISIFNSYENQIYDIEDNSAYLRPCAYFDLSNLKFSLIDELENGCKEFEIYEEPEEELTYEEELNNSPIFEKSNKTLIQTQEATLVPMYRLFNKYTGEHLFTRKYNEYSNLVKVGWIGESIHFRSYDSSGGNDYIPIYRIFNPNAPGGDHHYTPSYQEVLERVADGWKLDHFGKVAFYGRAKTTTAKLPMYRLYNKASGRHLMTLVNAEKNKCVNEGWTLEGISFYLPEAAVYSVRLGIDVSEWQGNINWTLVKASGIQFAIIRCFNGYKINDQTGRMDYKYERNVSECERLGIPYGVYTYSYAKTSKQAYEEAGSVINLVKGHYPSYPIFYDLEDPTIATGVDLASNAHVFCDRIEKHFSPAKKAGVYASLSWFNTKLTNPIFDNYTRWIASWDVKKCTYSKEFRLWQYSSKGVVNGISGSVDMNYDYQ